MLTPQQWIGSFERAQPQDFQDHAFFEHLHLSDLIFRVPEHERVDRWGCWKYIQALKLPSIPDRQIVTFAYDDDFFTGPFKNGKFSKVRYMLTSSSSLDTYDITPTLDEFKGDPESWEEVFEWIGNHEMMRGLFSK
mmetsp:Transcript_6855/g.11068  ORF Transcript_6855/g.11068 Transcript_6855/m.11068 type:complete len:136 (+) Transcript_6855:15-422(+)